VVDSNFSFNLFDALNLISIDTNFFNKILNRIESKIFLSYSVDKLSNNSFKLYLKSSADVTGGLLSSRSFTVNAF
jgi:hypothetical protein